MATVQATQTALEPVPIDLSSEIGKLSLRGSQEPLKSSGALDKYESHELTGHIGRQYSKVQLTELLESDELIRELAIIVSQRGVVVFKNQDITPAQQKVLGKKLGTLSGGPKASGLHHHPNTDFFARDGKRQDEEVTLVDTGLTKIYQDITPKHLATGFASSGWHTDITFERVPSDFALLKVHTLPSKGGDTLWASAYEAYDRLSPAYQKFLEPLYAVHEAHRFHEIAASVGAPIYTGERGHPANTGDNFSSIHPVIRTNPVTGWKGLFVSKGFVRRIIGLTKEESERTLNYLFSIYSENHDLQVRFRWSKDDVAIWTNTSTVHTATFDYFDEKRAGDRVVSIGEKPFFSPDSKSRREDLGLPAFYKE